MHEDYAMSPPPSVVNLACFTIGESTYALEVECLREVVRIAEITPLPNAPELIEGVIDLRGHLIPVLDLARVLGSGKASADHRARVAVLDFSGLVFGLWVDAATEVLALDASRLEDVPDLAAHAGYNVVSSMVRREAEAPVLVLSLDHIVESIYRSAPSGASAGEFDSCR
jgi:purine-binding chemotaxis protein CheW